MQLCVCLRVCALLQVLGVALNDAIYLWGGTDGAISQLLRLPPPQDLEAPPSQVTSLAWSACGSVMAVGESHAGRSMRDIKRWKCLAAGAVRYWSSHTAAAAS